jgi:hypothetical protein
MGRVKMYGFFLCLLLVIGAATPAWANIVLKILAVNPSKEQSQKVPVKAYLPKETKPEDVIDRADLDIAYDTQQGSYYVSGEYELKPGETVERSIEMRDIWVIPDAEIQTLRSEVNKISAMLKNTEFADRISFLNNSIDSKLNQIVENQKNAPPNPERHISDYRDNLRILESVKTDLALARSLMSQVKPTMSAKTIWHLIIGIILFLGLLGGGFYFVWQKQLKVITQEGTFYVPGNEQPTSSVKPKRREAKTEQGNIEAKDIENILKEKPKEEES